MALYKKDNKQTIFCRNYYRCRLRRWLSASCKTPAQDESLLHSLEQEAEGIGLYVNTNKTEFMCFKREGHFKGQASKISWQVYVRQQQYLVCERDTNIRRAKMLIAIDCLLIIWKPDLFEKLKRNFSKLWLCQYSCMNTPHGHGTKCIEKRLTRNYTERLHAIPNKS